MIACFWHSSTALELVGGVDDEAAREMVVRLQRSLREASLLIRPPHTTTLVLQSPSLRTPLLSIPPDHHQPIQLDLTRIIYHKHISSRWFQVMADSTSTTSTTTSSSTSSSTIASSATAEASLASVYDEARKLYLEISNSSLGTSDVHLDRCNSERESLPHTADVCVQPRPMPNSKSRWRDVARCSSK